MDAVVVDKLTKDYGNRSAIKDVSFSVRDGSIHGFLGPNGAGKSTTMKIMSGLLSATLGDVWIKGKKVSENPNYVKKIVGILPEELPLYEEMTVSDYLKFVGSIHGLKNNLAQRLSYTLDKTNLMDVKHRLIGNLSRGYKQRVGVAQALIFNPEILILDEPTLGLDPANIKEMREFILELKKDHTIILSSHLLDQVSQVCDDITIIKNGSIVTSGAYQDIISRFRSTNIIAMELKVKDMTSLDKLVKQNDFIESVDIVGNASSVLSVHFYLKREEDYRANLSQAVVEAKCNLLSMRQIKSDLEDVFLEVTKS